MSRQRQPDAVTLADCGGVLVKHTEDVDLAARLAREAIVDDRGGLESDEEVWLAEPRVIWCRILGRLPGSLAEAEGWGWEYRTSAGPGRGVFRAVEFPEGGVRVTSQHSGSALALPTDTQK